MRSLEELKEEAEQKFKEDIKRATFRVEEEIKSALNCGKTQARISVYFAESNYYIFSKVLEDLEQAGYFIEKINKINFWGKPIKNKYEQNFVLVRLDKSTNKQQTPYRG